MEVLAAERSSMTSCLECKLNPSSRPYLELTFFSDSSRDDAPSVPVLDVLGWVLNSLLMLLPMVWFIVEKKPGDWSPEGLRSWLDMSL